MTPSLHERLRDAADPVPAPPDGFALALRRGEQLRRRAMTIRLSAIPVVLLAVAVIAVSTLNGSGQALHTVGRPGDPEAPTTTTLAHPVSDPRVAAARPAVAAAAATRRTPDATVPPAPSVTRPSNPVPPLAVQFDHPAPPGTRIAFSRTDGTYTMALDGSDPERLIAGHQSSPLGWSPDGTKLLLEATDASYHASLVSLNVRTGQQSVLVNDLTNDVRGAGWSPDGSRIAYSLNNQAMGTWAVGMVNPDGSGAHTVVDNVGFEMWMADSRIIVWGSGCPNYTCTMKPDGSDMQPFTLPIPGNLLAVSPNGEWVAYEDPGTLGLRLIHPDGSGDHAVGQTPISGAAFTPDSNRIVYGRSYVSQGLCGYPFPNCQDQQQADAQRAAAGLRLAAVDDSTETRLTSDDSDSWPLAPWHG